MRNSMGLRSERVAAALLVLSLLDSSVAGAQAEANLEGSRVRMRSTVMPGWLRGTLVSHRPDSLRVLTCTQCVATTVAVADVSRLDVSVGPRHKTSRVVIGALLGVAAGGLVGGGIGQSQEKSGCVSFCGLSATLGAAVGAGVGAVVGGVAGGLTRGEGWRTVRQR